MITAKLEIASIETFDTLMDIDRGFRGTVEYMGLAFFWAHEYRHEMREQSEYRRRLVHKKLLEAGLNVSGVSDQHQAIIDRYAIIH